MPAATPRPAKRPATDAKRPTTAASASTDRSTCLRLAPIARSSAISRVRWATMIEKVLQMMNAPTSSAMTANTMQERVKKPSICLRVSACCSLVIASPVSTSVPVGNAWRDAVGELGLRRSVGREDGGSRRP